MNALGWCRPVAAVLFATALAAADGAAAHTRQRTAASVSGTVVDAATGRAVAGAVVTLEPAPRGLVTRSGELAAGWTVVTGADGSYAFPEVPTGAYRLRVDRLGYRPATVDAEVRRPVDARLSIGLELAPVALEAVRVEQRAEPPFRRAAAAAGDVDDTRIALERLRQELFLTSDTRALTYADLVDGVTLGESDVFRALHRLPGVATRDDYTAELWTRGAPWSHTRVTFDDVPLFNPVHAAGVFTGLTPEILGAVFFHPGVRPASIAEGAAGAVDLRTRSGGGDGGVRGTTDLSMATARIALDQRVGERGAWSFAARRSYLDVLDGGLAWLGADEVDLPYAFHDVAARVDIPLGAAALEASGLWEEDRLFGDVVDILEGTSARWGNAAGRVTLVVPWAGTIVRHTLGASRYAAHTWPAGLPERGEVPEWAEPPSDNRVLHVRWSGAIEPDGDAVAAWRAGYDVVAERVRYDGPEPRFHPVKPDTVTRLDFALAGATVGGWADGRWTAGRLAVQPGLRVELADAGGAVRARVAPRLIARWAASPELSLSVAAGRSYQTLQALGLAGPSAHPAFHAGQFWLRESEPAPAAACLGAPGTDLCVRAQDQPRASPALRTDLVTFGAERWLGRGFLASVTAYARRSAGVALPDPTPGILANRVLFVVGDAHARGIDLGLRRVAGRWTASAAYAYGESTIEVGGFRYPSSADRRHRVDLLLAARLTASLRAGLAFAAMSGAPYTRAYSRAAAAECSLFGFGCSQVAAAVQQPNALRTPDYRSLDAMVQWSRAFGDIEVGAYLQLRNALDRDNASTYSGSFVMTRPAAVRRVEYLRSAHWLDRFEKGLPRMPLLGARVAF
jgi:hypothetical protein